MPEQGVLRRVVHEHIETCLAEARARSVGDGLPHFVERELWEFLTCGQLARGFARFRCDECAPTCWSRSRATAAGSVRRAPGGAWRPWQRISWTRFSAFLPIRQWVLITPHRLRYVLAYDQRLCRRVLAVLIRAVLSFERRRAKRRGVADGRGGAVTAIQRFGSAANSNVHFHSLVAQGVFARDSARFVPLPAPSDHDVWRVLATVRRRIVRLARRNGIDLEGVGIVDGDHRDERAEESPLLAGLAAASVAGRSAIGAEAGRRAVRLGRATDAVPVEGSRAPCHAHIAGFDLHAGVAVPAGDRARLEHLARYVLRPPIAQESLAIAPDGRVVPRAAPAVARRHARAAGRPARLPRPPRAADASVARQFATVPRCVRLSRGTAARRRAAGAGGGRCRGRWRGSAPAGRQLAVTGRLSGGSSAARLRDRLLHCARCGGRLRFVAAIDDPDVVRRILGHLGLPASIAPPLPARPPPGIAQASFDWA